MQLLVTKCLVCLVRFLTGIRAHWRSCPSLEPQIYFANHTSHLDALVIWTSLPKAIRKRTRPVAAKDYWNKTCLRRYLANHVFNAILIDRTQPRCARQTIDQIIQTLGDGFSIIIFPEGTRGNGEQIKKFQTGIYHIVKDRPQFKLMPIYLDNLSRSLPKGEFLPIPILGSATFGIPIELQTHESKNEFVQRAQQSIETLRDNHEAIT
ncbi:MAG: lysophospholipid acyltransferase family protein [Phycisphaeraceae bacterium JB051]